MITLTPLEWRGFESAVAEMLEIHSGCARMLSLLCQRAPRMVSSESLQLTSSSRSDPKPDPTGQSVPVRISLIRRAANTKPVRRRIGQTREAADDIGAIFKIETFHGHGYRMSSEDADSLIRDVLDYVGQAPPQPLEKTA